MANEIVRASELPPNRPPEYPVEQVVFTPPIDIFETDEGLVLHADLPGVSPESLELQVQDNKLSLFGKVSLPIPVDARMIHQEYHSTNPIEQGSAGSHREPKACTTRRAG